MMNIETKTYSDGTTATGVAPLPDYSPRREGCSWPGCGCDPEGIDSPPCRYEHASAQAERLALAGTLRPFDSDAGPIAQGWVTSIGYGHDGYGVYAYMEEYPEEGSFLLHSLGGVQQDAYAEGRKDEREDSGASGLGGGVRSSPLSGSIPESSTTLQVLKRLHDWALAQQGDCMFSGDHPIAQAAAVIQRAIAADGLQWQPIETAPEDENVLVATTGGWVDTAFWTDDGDGPKWWWLISANEYAKHPLHPNLIPTHWMPLPKHPEAA